MLILSDQILADDSYLIEESKLHFESCRVAALWVPSNVGHVDLNVDVSSNRAGCLRRFSESCWKILFLLVIDTFVLGFTYLEPGHLALAHLQEGLPQIVKSLLVSDEELVWNLTLL